MTTRQLSRGHVFGALPLATHYGRALVPDDETRAERLLREAPASEQPTERLQHLGPGALSLAELFQIALDCPNDPLLSFRLLDRWKSLREFANASPLELRRIEGMTPRRVARLQAVLELARRATAAPEDTRPRVRRPKDIADLLMPEMSVLDREQMRVVLLSTKNDVMGIRLVYQGNVHSTVIRTAELFAEAVRANAPAIAIIHNHPSGSADPSPEDISATKDFVTAGKHLDIELVDHLIIGANRFVSLKERGIAFC